MLNHPRPDRTIFEAMKGVNRARFVVARQVITPDEVLQDTAVRLEGDRIAELVPLPNGFPSEAEVHRGEYLIPGMIDLHVNGSGGGDAAEGSHPALEKMSRSLAAHGTTTFLPTIITDHEENLLRSLRNLAGVLEDRYSGAVPAGIHLEGPFINPEKRGAHRPECIQKPSRELFLKYRDAAQGHLKMITLAPELEGALEVIREARNHLPIVSLGHSAADYQSAFQGIEQGANLATHAFNAMPVLHHRNPGLLGAVLDAAEVSAEIIADGIHVHPAMVRLLVRCKGPERVILVTDAISAAGMPDGDYKVGGLAVTVRDGVCREQDGRLAGSTLTMDRGLKNLAEWLEATPFGTLLQVVAMATREPARLLGLSRKGKIQPGMDADLVLLGRNLQVGKTFVAGELVFDSTSVPASPP